jgi:hypothetical protein
MINSQQSGPAHNARQLLERQFFFRTILAARSHCIAVEISFFEIKLLYYIAGPLFFSAGAIFFAPQYTDRYGSLVAGLLF